MLGRSVNVRHHRAATDVVHSRRMSVLAAPAIVSYQNCHHFFFGVSAGLSVPWILLMRFCVSKDRTEWRAALSPQSGGAFSRWARLLLQGVHKRRDRVRDEEQVFLRSFVIIRRIVAPELDPHLSCTFIVVAERQQKVVIVDKADWYRPPGKPVTELEDRPDAVIVPAAITQ